MTFVGALRAPQFQCLLASARYGVERRHLPTPNDPLALPRGIEPLFQP